MGKRDNSKDERSWQLERTDKKRMSVKESNLKQQAQHLQEAITVEIRILSFLASLGGVGVAIRFGGGTICTSGVFDDQSGVWEDWNPAL